MKKSLLALSLLLILLACGNPQRIKHQTSASGVIVEKLDWEDLLPQTEDTPFAINSKAVGLIDLPEERCTGFLIDKDLVMTNEHCIPNAQSARGVTITFGYDFGASDLDKITYQCERFIMANKKLDFAIVKCAQENGEYPGDHFGIVTLEKSEFVVREEVYLIQQNCPHHINSKCDPSKKIAYGKIYDQEDGEFVHDADTLGGSSGSPVFSKTNHHVLALHNLGIGSNGRGIGKYNMAVPMSVITAFIEKVKPDLLLKTKDPVPTITVPIEAPIIENPVELPASINSLIPGNSISSAMPLERGKTFGSFKIKKSGEKHIFKVVVKSSNSNTLFKVSLKGDRMCGNLDLFLLDSSGSEIVKSTFSSAEETVRILNKEGIYYIQVAGFNGAIGSYNLEIN